MSTRTRRIVLLISAPVVAFAVIGGFLSRVIARELAKVLVERYGIWIYAILLAIIFSETGLVVTPFLPGDSLLVTAGFTAVLITRSESTDEITTTYGLFFLGCCVFAHLFIRARLPDAPASHGST